MTTNLLTPERSAEMAAQVDRAPDHVVEVQDVHKTYREGKLQIAALRGVSIAVARGGFSLIVGASGSGKTTLLNLISAIDQPDSGRVIIDGSETTAMKDRQLTALRARKIGFIFQNFNLIPVLTAAENVEFALLGESMSKRERAEAVEETLAAVGLRDQAAQRPNQLSGGQRQRVAIARALVKRPAIILADEPTANLDSVTGRAIVSLMREIQLQSSTTFIVSTHNPDLMPMADKTYTLADGVIVGS